MKIYIPRPVTRSVPKEVYDSIQRQLFKSVVDNYEVIEVISGCESMEGAEHRIRSRNLILSLAKSLNDPYFVMMDSDTVLLQTYNFYQMNKEFQNDSKLGAVSLANQPVYDLSGHVDLACTMIKTEAVRDVQFRLGAGKCFECYALGIDLRKKGFEHRYLDFNIRIKSVEEVSNG